MKTFRIGVPAEDAALPVMGLSAPLKEKDQPCRWLAGRAVLALPVPERAANRVTLSLASSIEQELAFCVGGRQLGAARLPAGGGWVEAAFDLPAGLGGPLRLEIRAARPHPLDGFVPRCAMLRALSVETFADLPAPACAGRTEPLPAWRRFFGDLHVHTALSPCARPAGGTIASNCRSARQERGSDFIAFADHDSRMTPEQWRAAMQELAGFEKPGEFAALFGYEWTAFAFGQINVYSPSPELPLLSVAEEASSSPPRLWRALREWGGPALTIYHHPTRPGMPVNWEFFDEQLMPAVEIFSGWGNSEYCGAPLQKAGLCVPGTSVQDALSRGYPLGFVGGGDIHDGTPATRGLTCVLAERLDRQSVFEAIRARRCYATTGAKIELDFRVNGHPMGSVVPFTPYTAGVLYPLRVEYAVKGVAPLAAVEVVTDGGVVVHRRTLGELGGSAECQGRLELADPVRGAPPGGAAMAYGRRHFYLRVTQAPARGISERIPAEMAWSSPVFLAPDYSALV